MLPLIFRVINEIYLSKQQKHRRELYEQNHNILLTLT